MLKTGYRQKSCQTKTVFAYGRKCDLVKAFNRASFFNTKKFCYYLLHLIPYLEPQTPNSLVVIQLQYISSIYCLIHLHQTEAMAWAEGCPIDK